MGPSGSGKTTVGHALAQSLGWPFCEGDELHPEANVSRMRSGIALTDADRAPWLAALAKIIERHVRDGSPGVIACSALKRAYRVVLVPSPGAAKEVCFVYLDAGRDVLAERLEKRRGHFFAASMLDSQLEALEPPAEGEPAPVIGVDASQPVDVLVQQIREALALG